MSAPQQLAPHTPCHSAGSCSGGGPREAPVRRRAVPCTLALEPAPLLALIQHCSVYWPPRAARAPRCRARRRDVRFLLCLDVDARSLSSASAIRVLNTSYIHVHVLNQTRRGGESELSATSCTPHPPPSGVHLRFFSTARDIPAAPWRGVSAVSTANQPYARTR